MTPEHLALSAGLSPAECEAFFLACEGMDRHEIAARLGITLNAVSIRLTRAGQRIREERRRLEAMATLDRLLARIEGVVKKT